MVADDIYPGTKHNSASVCSLYLLENMESKLISFQYNLGLKHQNFFLRIISFSSLESQLSFDSKDSKINFHQTRLTTVKSLLGALRALCNISSDDEEDLFVDELLVY